MTAVLAWPPAGPEWPFALDGLDRMSFASPAAEQLWKPRLARLRAAALAAEFDAVRRGRSRQARLWVSYRDLGTLLAEVASDGLQAEVDGCAIDHRAPVWSEEDFSSCEALAYRLSVRRAGGSPWDGAGPPEAPTCCARAWEKRSEAGARDPLSFLLMSGGSGPLVSMAAFATLGFGPLRHAPCGVDCCATLAQVAAGEEALRALGFADEAAWLSELSRGSCRASIRSGLAEVTTPWFRFAYASDRRPQCGVRTVPVVSDVPSRAEDAVAPDRALWIRLMWEQAASLGRARSLLHLDCGDGLLMAAALSRSRRLTAIGTTDSDRHAATATRRCGSRAEVLNVDWTVAPEVHVRPRDGIDLVVLRAARLLSLDASGRSRALAALARHRSIVAAIGDLSPSATVEARALFEEASFDVSAASANCLSWRVSPQ